MMPCMCGHEERQHGSRHERGRCTAMRSLLGSEKKYQCPCVYYRPRVMGQGEKP